MQTDTEIKAKKRAYYLANRLKYIASAGESQKRNRKHRRIYLREYHQKIRIKVINFLGGKCKRCGFSDYRALQIDHVHGGGVKEHREVSSYKYSKMVMGNKENKYQLLCANCNWIKAHENEETTKKYKKKDMIKHLEMDLSLEHSDPI